MAKNTIWKVLGGLAVAGAAAGGALAYFKKCKDVNDLSEEDFDDLLDDEEEDCGCQTERTYTTLPNETASETPEEDSEEEDSEEEAPAEEAEEESSAPEATEEEASVPEAEEETSTPEAEEESSDEKSEE